MRPGWLRPTLTRRLIGALLLAFTLCAVLLLVQDQLDIQETLATDPGIRQYGRELAAGLEEIDDESLAARVLDGHLRHVNRLRESQRMTQGPLLARLIGPDGRLVYTSATAFDLDRPGVGEHQIAGRTYWT